MKRSYKKRLLSLLCSLILIVTTISVSGISVSADVYPGFPYISRMAAAEGIVLLENPAYGTDGENNENNQVLPIKNGQTVSIFGVVQDYYYSSGAGSGQAPTTEYVIGIADGLRNNPNVKVNEELATIYKAWIKKNPFVFNSGWSSNPSWGQKEMPLTEEIVQTAASKSDAAVVIIGRTAGEDLEAKNQKGSYLLTDAELDMIRKVYAEFDRVAVVLNTAHVLDMKWVSEVPDAAIVYVWQGGLEGGSATADVLTGDLPASGKLTDTIAENIEDYPAYGNHYCMGSETLKYEEDIYVGYRYFETFEPNKVLYPFGYGLSYTDFTITTNDVRVSNGSLTKDSDIYVDVTVKNTGAVKGKEVVQVYFSAPQGEIGKPAKELAAFAKTGVLKPGESQQITLTFNAKDMSSYDDSGVTGHDSCYVLEDGEYKIFVGNDVKNNTEAKEIELPETIVTEELQEAMAPTRALKRIKPGEQNADGSYELTYEDVPLREIDLAQRIQDNLPEAVPLSSERNLKLIDVYNGDAEMDDFIAQFTPRDLAAITMGEDPDDSVIGGIAGRFGGVTKSLKELGIPNLSAADGPAGIRRGSVATTSIPIGTMLACTWNVDLVQMLYEYVGKEMVINTLDTLLGPGIEVHRIPLGGRNFEYYSEDPLVTGIMGCAAARGIQCQGPSPTVKHMAMNHVENGAGARREYNVHISERAIREIYLKGFEIAVKSGDLRCIMTAYNAINGTWAASNYDMNTTIVRGEWGYNGILMTDWWGDFSEDQAFYSGGRVTGTQGSQYMIRAQNDLYMKHNGSGAVEKNLGGFNTLSEYEKGNITLGELQRTARNICNYILKSQALARQEGIEYKPVYEEGPDWFTVEKDVPGGNPLLTEITIGGKKISDGLFNELKLEYKAFYKGEGSYPVVAAVGADGTTVTIEQATDKMPAAIITATAGMEERIYKIIFTEESGLEPIFDDPAYAYLSEIKIDGELLAGFDENTFNYDVVIQNPDEMPVVTAVGKDGATVTITPDAANKTVSIRCASDDQANTYSLCFGKAPETDEFDSTTLKPIWKINTETDENYENPANWSLTDNPGSLRITAERGSFFEQEAFLKNYFQQDAFGDWEATAKIDMNRLPANYYECIGITAGQDNDNYVFLKYEFAGKRMISMCRETNGPSVDISSLSGSALDEIIGTQTTVYFRLKKVGNTYTGYVSKDGENFVKMGSASAEYENPKFGLLTSTGGANPSSSKFYADFDYIRFEGGTKASVFDFEEINTKMKVAEIEPAAISSSLAPAVCNDADAGKHLTGSVKGAFVTYDVNVKTTGEYKLVSRFKASNNNPLAQMSFSVLDGDKNLAEFSYISDTNGSWATRINPGSVYLTEGQHRLKIMFDANGIDLNWLEFQLIQGNVDTSALSDLIAEAEEIDLAGYSASKSSQFVISLNDAKLILAEAPNQSVVDKAIADLQAAIYKLQNLVLPVNIPPRAVTNIENGIRITPTNFPWSHVADDRYNYSGGSTNWTTGNDIFYLGKIDLTGLKEIKVRFGSGNNGNFDFRFFTNALESGEPTKYSASSGERYDDLYKGGAIELKDEVANISLSQSGGSWSRFATSSTAQTPSDNNQVTYTYGGNSDNYIVKDAADGEQNLYLLLEVPGAAVNLCWVDLIYSDTATVDFDLNYDEAPEPPSSVKIVAGEGLGSKLPTPVRDGYVFQGWKTESTGGESVTADTPISESTTLYAQWAKVLDIEKTESSVKAKAAILNDGGETKSVQVIVAVYDNAGVLIKVNQSEATVPAGELGERETSVDLEGLTNAASAKAFLWEQGTMVPLCASVETAI